LASTDSLVEKMIGWLGKGVQAFISPSPEMCACCGKQPKSAGLNPLGTCRSCMEIIPWISQIRCPVCGRYEDCPDCIRRTKPPLYMNRSAVQYDDRMRELLALYKYRGDERLQVMLGRMLVHAYRLFPDGTMIDLLTYVPLGKERYEERGFNQAEQLARVLAEEIRKPVLPLLRRLKNTGKMSLKSRQERLEGMTDVFAVDPERVARIRRFSAGRAVRIAIVDDVYTTGSTLNHCASVIREAIPEAQVYGLCWAR
jgi:competence protein ComFC